VQEARAAFLAWTAVELRIEQHLEMSTPTASPAAALSALVTDEAQGADDRATIGPSSHRPSKYLGAAICAFDRREAQAAEAPQEHLSRKPA